MEILNIRGIAVMAAVGAFFLVCVSGVCSGRAVDTACMRGILGGAAAYIVVGWAARIVNNIVSDAMTNTSSEDKQVVNAGRDDRKAS